jgi:UPF0716 protein FxsA
MSPARPAGGRARRVLAVVALLLLVVPIIEIAVIIAVGRAIGGWPTLALLVVESAFGAWLVRREGSRAWTALSGALIAGRMPAGELADAALVLVGGTLLLTPGFVTDVLGLIFVIPLTRPLAGRVISAIVAQQLLPGPGVWGPVVRGSVIPGAEPEEDERPGR